MALPCVNNCPNPLDEDDKPKIDLYWSDPLTWINGYPKDGDRLVIP